MPGRSGLNLPHYGLLVLGEPCLETMAWVVLGLADLVPIVFFDFHFHWFWGMGAEARARVLLGFSALVVKDAYLCYWLKSE